MRSTRFARAAACLVGVLVLTAACAQPATDPPPPLPGMTPVPVAPPSSGFSLTADQIAASLLGPGDVPADWEQDSVPEGAELSAGGAGGTGTAGVTISPPECAGAGGTPQSTDRVAGGATQFYTPDVHYVVESVTTWASDPGPTMIDGVNALVAQCTTATMTDAEGATATVTFVAETPPSVGDRSTAYTVETTQQFGDVQATYTAITYVVLVGNVSVVVIAGGATPLDRGLVDDLVSTAVAKVEAA